MSKKDHILHLVVFSEVFNKFKRGEKPVEYHEKDYWAKKIIGQGFKWVRMQNGFHKDPATGKVPTIMFEIKKIDIGPTDPRWTMGIVSGLQDFVRIWVGDEVKENEKRD